MMTFNEFLESAKARVQEELPDAEVKIHIYYHDHEGELELEYFYYDGEWMLSNTVEAVKHLTVDGRDYDEAEVSAFEQVAKEF